MKYHQKFHKAIIFLMLWTKLILTPVLRHQLNKFIYFLTVTRFSMLLRVRINKKKTSFFTSILETVCIIIIYFRYTVVGKMVNNTVFYYLQRIRKKPRDFKILLKSWSFRNNCVFFI